MDLHLSNLNPYPYGFLTHGFIIHVGRTHGLGAGYGYRSPHFYPYPCSALVEAGGGGEEVFESGAVGVSSVGDAEELRGLVQRVADGFIEGHGDDAEACGGRGEQEEGVCRRRGA